MAKVGIIGTGWGARVQVPAFREAGLEVVGIAGRDAEKTRRQAGELKVRPFDDWRALLDERAIDVVTIVTPPHEHLAIATAALDAGKHVISEKPTALNVGEAEELVAAAKRHPDRIALIDHELRFLPSFRDARARLRDLGNVWYAEARYASPGRGDVNREWNWWSDRQQGGGIWGAVGSHLVDTLRFLGCEIVAAQATMHTAIRERPFRGERRAVTSDDCASVTLRLANGGIAMLSLTAVAAVDEPTTITVRAERGAIRLTGEELLMTNRWHIFERVSGGELQKRPGNSAGGAFGSGTLLLGRAVRAAIDEGDRNALADAATFEDGLAQQRVLDAARRSSDEGGRWVEV